MGDFIDEIMGLKKDFEGISGDLKDLKNVGKDLPSSLLGISSNQTDKAQSSSATASAGTDTAAGARTAVATAEQPLAADSAAVATSAPSRRGVIITCEPEDIDPAEWEAQQQAIKASEEAARAQQLQEQAHAEERQQFISSMVDKATSAAMYSKTTRPVAIAAKNLQKTSDKLSAAIGVDSLYETGKQAVIKNGKDWVDFAKEKLDL